MTFGSIEIFTPGGADDDKTAAEEAVGFSVVFAVDLVAGAFGAAASALDGEVAACVAGRGDACDVLSRAHATSCSAPAVRMIAVIMLCRFFICDPHFIANPEKL